MLLKLFKIISGVCTIGPLPLLSLSLSLFFFASSLNFFNLPGGSDGKASVYNAGDPDSIPGLGRSPGEGNGNPLQYPCLENPMDGGVW